MFLWNDQNAAVAAAHSVDPERWWTAYDAVIDRIAPRFARYEPLRHAGGLMLGMLSGLDRKNCWTIAETAVISPRTGCSICSPGRSGTPTRCVMIWVATSSDAFGEPHAVLVVDETAI